MSRTGPAAPEFSRRLAVAALREGGERLALEATAEERAALARRFGIEGVRSLTAALTVTPKAKGAVAVRGRVQALLDRTCVVTLEPLEEEIDAPLAILFRPEGAEGRELSLEAGGEDEEPYHGGAIDLGEAVAQTLALALDPWPRAAAAAAGQGPGR
jgi:uncharacterized metal-binding protein YceD (DUF177 family)